MREELAQVQRVVWEQPHTQVRVESPNGPIEVDAGMVTILQHLWAKGVNTRMSCEDNNGAVWIQMEVDDYIVLMQKARASADLLWFLQACLNEIRTTHPEEFHGMELEADEEPFEPPTITIYEVAIRFPKRHKELFERLLQAWEVPRKPWPLRRVQVHHSG